MVDDKCLSDLGELCEEEEYEYDDEEPGGPVRVALPPRQGSVHTAARSRGSSGTPACSVPWRLEKKNFSRVFFFTSIFFFSHKH